MTPFVRMRRLLCLAAVLCACSPPALEMPAAKPPRLVLLYAACTVHAGFLEPYDPAVAYTPRLAEFGRRAVVFERHMTEEGQSGIAFASIFSGRQSDGHGVYYHPVAIDPRVPLIGEVFRDGGFHVEEWLAHVMASGELGYGRGADRVSDLTLTADAPELLQILRRLADDPGARALVVATHALTHAPYRIESLQPFCDRFPGECALPAADPQRFMAAAGFYLNHVHRLSGDFDAVAREYDLGADQIEYLARVIEVLYRANVARLDHHFGTLLDAVEALGLADEALVVFTADHGEAFDRDEALFPWTHGYQLAPEVLRVPLLMRGPGLEPRRYQSVSRSTDLLPTLASLAGVPAPALPPQPWNGVDLSAAVRGTEPEPWLDAYSHTSLMAGFVAEMSRGWPRFRRYFPREDPELMWAQLRSGDTVSQLRGVFEPQAAGPETWVLRPRHLRLTPRQRVDPDPVEPAAAEQIEQLERLRRYRDALIAAHHARPDATEGDIGEDRKLELLRSLGYVE